MKLLRPFLLAFTLLFGTHAAHAQYALYANLEADNLKSGSANWFTGGTFGLYDDFLKLGPIRAGADVRGSILSGSGSQSYIKALGGFRVAAKPPILPIKPYVQISAGVAGLSGNHHLAYEANGGVDLTFFPHLDWRVAEIGGGSGDRGTPFHIGTGLVVRFF